MKAYKHIPTNTLFKLNKNENYYADENQNYKVPIYLVEENTDFEPYEYPKNYEILTLINDNDDILEYTHELLESSDFEIHSVKRISDQAIFTLLDTVNLYENITKLVLYEDENRITAYTTYSVKRLEDLKKVNDECDVFYGYVYYNVINSSKKKKTIFKYKNSFEFQMAAMHTVKYLRAFFIEAVDHVGNAYRLNNCDSQATILEMITPK